MENHSDSLWVVQLKKGNKFAFEQLYERYSAKLFNSISILLYDKELAKDITQNCFLTVWEKRHLLEPDKNFQAYLYTIARNLVYKETERLILHNKYMEYKLHDSEASGDDMLEDLDSAHIEDYINQQIRQMPQISREIFNLKRNDNLSNREIAGRMNLSERAVEAHYYRTLKILKEKLRMFIMLVFIV